MVKFELQKIKWNERFPRYAVWKEPWKERKKEEKKIKFSRLNKQFNQYVYNSIKKIIKISAHVRLCLRFRFKRIEREKKEKKHFPFKKLTTIAMRWLHSISVLRDFCSLLKVSNHERKNSISKTLRNTKDQENKNKTIYYLFWKKLMDLQQ